ncbi:hypothetical protein ALP01_200207 [Pseudomonas caricapapayae]|nr:hypothetical protein ALP01_200207 [Pseudomonas caricapapayae]
MAHKKSDQPGIGVLAVADALHAEYLKRLARYADAKRIQMFPVGAPQRPANFQTARLRREKGTPVEQIQE